MGAAGGDDIYQPKKGRRRMYSSTAFTTHYRGGAPWRRGAMRKTSSTAQPRQGRGLAVTSMRTTALGSTEWAARRIRAGRAAPQGGLREAAASCSCHAERSTRPHVRAHRSCRSFLFLCFLFGLRSAAGELRDVRELLDSGSDADRPRRVAVPAR
jgi:hypothetical protein